MKGFALRPAAINIIGKLLTGKLSNQYYDNLEDTQYILPDNEKVLLPNVLFWDPLATIQKNIVCPLCTKPSLLKNTNEWEKGQSNSRKPRLIWDSGWYCALVGRIYSCPFAHKIVSYHAGITKQLPIGSAPFFLSHDSGMMLSVFDFLMTLINNGNNFHSSETILGQLFAAKFCRKSSKLNQHNLKVVDFFTIYSPSDNFIKKSFVTNYENYKKLYDIYLTSIHAVTISCDHTFKTACNIGVYQEERWITLFDSIFLIVNENGQVMAYKLCKGTAFDKVCQELEAVGSRNPNLHTIYLDNCCTWKNKLGQLFPACDIKLDLFHAVKRLTEQLSKRHPYYSDICKDISLVFREKGDFEEKRLLPTPCSSTISENLSCLVKKWDSIERNGWKILNDGFYKAVDNLQIHIDRNCLSSIRVGHGTNRNENIHKNLKRLVLRSRLTVDTAHALLNNFFYSMNVKISGQKVVIPIWAQDNQPASSDEIIDLSFAEPSIESATNSVSGMPNISIKKDSNRVEGLPLIKPSDFLQLSDHQYCVMSKERDLKKIVVLANFAKKIYGLFEKSVTKKLLTKQFFLLSLASNWNLCSYYDQISSEEQSTMDTDKLVNALNLKKVDAYLKQTIVQAISFHLHDVCRSGIASSLENQFFHHHNLRSSDNPQMFLTTIQDVTCSKEEEPYKIIKNIADILGIVLILVPSSFSLPVIPVVPTNEIIFNQPLYLFVEFEMGSALYSSLQPVVTQESNEASIAVFCRCGVNDQVPTPRCKTDPRCKCLKAGGSCSTQCQCKNCFNGKPMEIKSRQRRKRTMPELSKYKSVNSVDAALNYGVEIINDRVSVYQHWILEATIFVHAISAERSNSAECQRLISIFQEVINYTEARLVNPDCFLTCPEQKKVLKWYNYREHNVQYFIQMSRIQ